MQVDIVKVEAVELDEMWSFVAKKSNQRWLWGIANGPAGAPTDTAQQCW